MWIYLILKNDKIPQFDSSLIYNVNEFITHK